jgi:hypothetical protein
MLRNNLLPLEAGKEVFPFFFGIPRMFHSTQNSHPLFHALSQPTSVYPIS